MNSSRVNSLDWQRGLLALSIMLYHLTSWQIQELDSSSLLGKFGIYGVSMFFVLSGLSMALVYNDYIKNVKTSLIFIIRRIFRIWPLLWLAVIIVTAGKIAMRKNPEWILVALNLTTSFGFVSPESYINAGAWSIGNEMVYYTITPIIIYAYNKGLIYGNILTTLTVAVALLFSLNFLSAENTLSDQWRIYINPFNNLFFYSSGIAIYYNFRLLSESAKNRLPIILVPLSLLLLIPAQGDQINIVTGWTRTAYSVASISMVMFFYKIPFNLPRSISHTLTQLGIATYGIYLLHPIFYQATNLLFKKINLHANPYAIISVTIALTIVSAIVIYNLFELSLIRFGKKITTSGAGAVKL